MTTDIHHYLKQLSLPQPQSHKGQNGKLLIIGGSQLFHAASKWSLDIASKFVDMVFYASVPSNNQLIQDAKKEFWNGIVISREEIENYLTEADCVLIGPGMMRKELSGTVPTALTDQEWNEDTEKVVNYLLHTYPEKKWVIDAGALQMVQPSLLNVQCIITPHYRELKTIFDKLPESSYVFGDFLPNVTRSDDPALQVNLSSMKGMSQELQGATVLIKGQADYVGNRSEALIIEGGNAGMTKGGTGDTLAGLVAALYCTNSSMTAAAVGSYANKKAGEYLYKKVGPFFNASDLVEAIPEVFWKELQ